MPSTSEQARAVLDRIFSKTTKGIKLGLDRMVSAAARVGDPHLGCRSIHVAGTNGKGSICASLDAMLRGAGFRTGLYTSPHLIHFEERYLIDGKPVETWQWLDIYRAFEPVIDRYDLTFFETTTLIAFELFRRNGVEWAIYETGLGGRLDATNILKPAVAVIGAIGMDHVQYLGDDILTIAGEKLGIAKPHTPLIMYRPENQRVEELVRKHCHTHDISLRIADSTTVQRVTNPQTTNGFVYKEKAIFPPFEGGYQIGNTLCAIYALEQIIPDRIDSAIDALGEARLPGRYQIMAVGGKSLVFDVAHNPQAAEALVSTLMTHFGEKPVRFVAGIMKDKDASAMLQQYTRAAGEIIFTRPNTPRALTSDELVAICKRSCCIAHRAVESVKAAVEYALGSSDRSPICVTGSFFTVGEAMQALEISPY
ncbi:MAG: bifunctional folylpolyglutamate synthase/dihydrofolate synthase [Chitinivibrionales bacterium]